MTKFYEDTKYILMCRKAEEIQKLRIGEETTKLAFGDHFYWKSDYRERIDVLSYQNVQIKSGVIEIVWIPRQDQLQEMATYGDTLGELLFRFNDFLENGYKQRIDPQPQAYFDSMEQLYLAMVMREKFNKTWDDAKGVWE